ncbi:DMT family transporter [Sphingomonas sp. PB2P19]|uniref:EamA family transporter n=1 Tax=Sphingomonas rhamnosi TaxID=3096156 RepID=UPI002FC6FC7B
MTEHTNGVASRLGPIAPLVLSMISLCVGTSFAKTLFGVAGPAGMTALRIGISALLLIALQRPWRWRIDARQARAVIGYGVVLAFMNLSFYAALSRLPLGVAIAIEFLGPLGVAVAYSRSRLDMLWVALAAGGIVALMLPGASGHPIDPIGVGFALLAAFGWAAYIVVGKHATVLVPERQIVCLGLCAAALIAVPAGIVQAGAALLDTRVLLAGCVVAVFSSALPYSLEMFAIKRLPKQVFGIVVSLEPAIGAAAAFVILGERLGGLQWLGMAGVVAASIGATLARPRAPLTDVMPV